MGPFCPWQCFLSCQVHLPEVCLKLWQIFALTGFPPQRQISALHKYILCKNICSTRARTNICSTTRANICSDLSSTTPTGSSTPTSARRVPLAPHARNKSRNWANDVPDERHHDNGDVADGRKDSRMWVDNLRNLRWSGPSFLTRLNFCRIGNVL